MIKTKTLTSVKKYIDIYGAYNVAPLNYYHISI